MEFIHLPCCKTHVHWHCVLEGLQSNNQCVYCQAVLKPQDIIDLPTLPQQKAQPEAPQEEISSNMNVIVHDKNHFRTRTVSRWTRTVSRWMDMMTINCLHWHAQFASLKASISPLLTKSMTTLEKMYTLITLERKFSFPPRCSIVDAAIIM
jgi:hypothetical protein